MLIIHQGLNLVEGTPSIPQSNVLLHALKHKHIFDSVVPAQNAICQRTKILIYLLQKHLRRKSFNATIRLKNLCATNLIQ